MSEKLIKTRVIQKHDTAENWAKATNFIPKQGELIVYDKDATHTSERLKVGDGSTIVDKLPFVTDGYALVSDVEALDAIVLASAKTYTDNVAANKVDKVSGKGLSTNDYTTAEKNKLTGIASGAEVNQNAFAKITVGSTTITADAKQDTVTFVAGNNVTLTPDATNDKITIAATDTVYTHPSYTAADKKLYKVAVDGLGHVSSVTEVVKSDITALGIPAQDTVYTHPSSHAASMITGLAKVATTGSYNDLSDKPSIPTVNNAALTIQKNGTAVATFTANSSTAVTANITVPTKVSELTNDSGYKTTDNNTTYSISKSGSTITLTGSDGSTSTVSDSNTVYTHPTYTAHTGKPTANQTPAFGGSVTVSQITSDTQGHVSGMTDRTITIPATLSNGTGTAGLIKTTSTVATTSGYTPCPVLNGVPYYKDTNTTKLTITATASDDDVVILTGANGTNGVSYTATHAKKGPTSGYTSGNATTSISGSDASGTIKIPQLTVDEYGHVTSATDESVTIKMPKLPTTLKNPKALSIGGKSYDGSAAVSITAADLGIDNAIHFIGETTTVLTDGATTDSITIGTDTVAPDKGDVVLYNYKEFLWTGESWKELGDGASHALKTITITAGNGLTGGGDLSANRTISHADTSSQGSIASTARTYISAVTLDTYGHVTGLQTAKETVTDTNQKVKVGTTTFGSNDTVEFVAGNNIALTASTTSKSIKIDATLTGYTKGTSTEDVAATDTLNTAIGKLEARIAALEEAMDYYVAKIYELLGGE